MRSSLILKDYVITDFGAVNDGIALNTKAMQAAIDQAHQEGGGKVVVPAGKYLCGTVIMKDNVELHLKHGAYVLGSTNPAHLIRQEITPYRSLKDEIGWYAIFYAAGAKNIAITGKGTIDGQGANQLPREVGSGDRDDNRCNYVWSS